MLGLFPKFILINPGISSGRVSFSPELRATHQSAEEVNGNIQLAGPRMDIMEHIGMSVEVFSLSTGTHDTAHT